MATLSSAPVREKRIKVCVRLRPFTRIEKLRAGGKAAWTWHLNTIYQQIFPAQIPSRSDDEEKKKRSGGSTASSRSSALRDSSSKLPSSYTFDYLYPPASQTQSVYQETVKDVIMAAMDGYHSSVFLYGQTGTGKTYTMQGGRGDPGIIQLGVQDIFEHIARHSNMEFLLRFSYLEIYNERIHDLLAAGAKSDIKIYDVHNRAAGGSGSARDGFATKDVVIRGLREEIVLSTEHVLSLVEVGNLHRHMAMTESNDQSSRSHVVFRLVIESQAKRSGRNRDEVAPVRSATLNIIDLAGSESVRLANTTGQALEEGKFINRSLLTLGHIIWKLSCDRHRTSSSTTGTSSSSLHLPYRNSKLTRILQPSLGGQAQIAIVCTASPSVECLAETHNTLKFATRARRVRNRVVVNENLGESALLRKYRARIRELEEQLAQLQSRRRPRSAVQVNSTNPSALSERQMELQFAINNINRVILNSSHAQERPDAEELASVDDDTVSALDAAQDTLLSAPTRQSDVVALQKQRNPTLEQHEVRQHVEMQLQTPLAPSRTASHPLPGRGQAHSVRKETAFQQEREEEDNGDVDPVRPRPVHSGSSAPTSSKTLIGSSGSASTRTLPLSTSSSRHLVDPDNDLAEAKEESEEDEPEQEEEVEPEKGREASTIAQSTQGTSRPSLTAMLKNKYVDELAKMEQRAGRWQRTREDELFSQKELLREFVRGLEIAQAEQETRMSKIRELELENRQLRDAVASRDDDGLSQRKTKSAVRSHDA